MWRRRCRSAWLLTFILLTTIGCVISQPEKEDNTVYPEYSGNGEVNYQDMQERLQSICQSSLRKICDIENDEGISTKYDDANADAQEHARTKRFLSIFRTRGTKSEGYKRGPGFRSWGGKRSGAVKRVGFSSWGGKRDDVGLQSAKREFEFSMPFEQFNKRTNFELGAKRQPFHTWGGKRNMLSKSLGGPLYLRQADIRKLLSWEGKRRFSSWGGKRSGNEFEESSIEKRSPGSERRKSVFTSWGGKRRVKEENAQDAADISENENSNH